MTDFQHRRVHGRSQYDTLSQFYEDTYESTKDMNINYIAWWASATPPGKSTTIEVIDFRHEIRDITQGEMSRWLISAA